MLAHDLAHSRRVECWKCAKSEILMHGRGVRSIVGLGRLMLSILGVLGVCIGLLALQLILSYSLCVSSRVVPSIQY